MFRSETFSADVLFGRAEIKGLSQVSTLPLKATSFPHRSR